MLERFHKKTLSDKRLKEKARELAELQYRIYEIIRQYEDVLPYLRRLNAKKTEELYNAGLYSASGFGYQMRWRIEDQRGCYGFVNVLKSEIRKKDIDKMIIKTEFTPLFKPKGYKKEDS